MVRISEGRTRDAHQDVRFIRGDFLQLLLRPTELVGADGGMVPDTFDLVTCLGGTLCELTGATDLLAVLQRVAAVLAPGGRLIFDTFSEAEFATWDAADMVLHDRDGLLVYQRRAYNWNTTIATCRTVWFAREEDLWWRAEEQYRLRCWSKVQILSALEHAGLILTALLELSLPGERWARTIYCVQRKVV
jgi:SAM-dependent methyltransferase